MVKTDDHIVVFVTVNSVKKAGVIAKELLSQKAAACVNTLGIDSIFTWKSKIEKTKEILLIVKSRHKLFKKIEKIIRQFHSYEVPEIIALPIIAGHKPYLDWINENTK
ncbi:MAG: divalent-cation tolerance protein CutA [Candidatus Omnitrophota bacterium]